MPSGNARAMLGQDQQRASSTLTFVCFCQCHTQFHLIAPFHLGTLWGLLRFPFKSSNESSRCRGLSPAKLLLPGSLDVNRFAALLLLRCFLGRHHQLRPFLAKMCQLFWSGRLQLHCWQQVLSGLLLRDAKGKSRSFPGLQTGQQNVRLLLHLERNTMLEAL